MSLPHIFILFNTFIIFTLKQEFRQQPSRMLSGKGTICPLMSASYLIWALLLTFFLIKVKPTFTYYRKSGKLKEYLCVCICTEMFTVVFSEKLKNC